MLSFLAYFFFRCMDNVTMEEEVYAYEITTPTYPPYGEYRGIRSRVYEWGGGGGYMAAEFDDVYLVEGEEEDEEKFEGDFNGDGKTDILWRDQQNGDVWIWLMDGALASPRTAIKSCGGADLKYEIVD